MSSFILEKDMQRSGYLIEDKFLAAQRETLWFYHLKEYY